MFVKIHFSIATRTTITVTNNLILLACNYIKRTTRRNDHSAKMRIELTEKLINKYKQELPEEVRPSANKKKFASKMRSIVSAVKTAQRLEVILIMRRMRKIKIMIMRMMRKKRS